MLTYPNRFFSFLEYITGLALLVIFYFDRNWANYAQFYLDTDYLYWTYRFPTVSLCSPAFSQNYFNLQRSCNETLIKCQWNGVPFACCQYFNWAYTTNGSCLSFNSDQTVGKARFFANSRDKPASLSVTLKSHVYVFIHDPKELDLNINNNSEEREGGEIFVVNGSFLTIFIKSIGAIITDESMNSLNFNQRGCILPGELDGTLSYYSVYSSSACQIECEFGKQMNRCNCSEHYLLAINRAKGATSHDHQGGYKNGAKKYCDNSNEVECINDFRFGSTREVNHNYKFGSAALYKQWHKDGCFCPPACEQNEYRIVWQQLKRYSKNKLKIKVKLISTPKERIIMQSRFEWLQIIIGLICFSRLFTSKSLVSVGCALLKMLIK